MHLACPLLCSPLVPRHPCELVVLQALRSTEAEAKRNQCWQQSTSREAAAEHRSSAADQKCGAGGSASRAPASADCGESCSGRWWRDDRDLILQCIVLELKSRRRIGLGWVGGS